MKALLAICALSIGCNEAVVTPPPSTSSGAEGVTLRVATPEHLAGSYVDVSGLALDFDTARTADALFIHLAIPNGHVLIDAETTADAYVFHYLDRRLTLSIDKAWVAQVEAEGDDGPAAQDTSAMHWAGDMSVLDEMLALPEMKVLPWLSRALGVMGYTGSAYPASLALHKMARQSADALGIELPPLLTASSEGSYCERPTANDCYGMCGPGCTCWSWVCGDCCYHSGCAKHDSWCRAGQWYYCYNITAVIALFGC